MNGRERGKGEMFNREKYQGLHLFFWVFFGLFFFLWLKASQNSLLKTLLRLHLCFVAKIDFYFLKTHTPHSSLFITQ